MNQPMSHPRIVLNNISLLHKEGFIASTEVKYKDFLFDIFAVNPETKEMKVIEVVVTSDHRLAEKEALCTKLGIDFKIIVPKYDNRNTRTIIDGAASCFSNPTRINVLELLYLRNLPYSEIMNKIGLNPKKDMGKFAYHLRILLKNGLIKKDREMYYLTALGKKAIDVFNQLKTLSNNDV
jgi:predicted transcriptional regulator